MITKNNFRLCTCVLSGNKSLLVSLTQLQIAPILFVCSALAVPSTPVLQIKVMPARPTLCASLVIHSELDDITILERCRLRLYARRRQSSVVEKRARRRFRVSNKELHVTDARQLRGQYGGIHYANVWIGCSLRPLSHDVMQKSVKKKLKKMPLLSHGARGKGCTHFLGRTNMNLKPSVCHGCSVVSRTRFKFALCNGGNTTQKCPMPNILCKPSVPP